MPFGCPRRWRSQRERGVFLLARRVTSDGGALAAAVFFALLPRTLLQGVEARSYSIATAVFVVGVVLLTAAPARAKTLSWIAGIVAVILAVWMFAFVALALPGIALLVADGTRRGRLKALATLLVPTASAVPLGIMMWQQQGQVSWLADAPLNPYTVLVEPMLGWAAWLAVPLILIVAAGVIRRRFRPHRHTVALLVWLTLPPVALLIVTLLGKPVFSPRYLIETTPAFAMLCGMLVGQLRRRELVTTLAIWMIGVAPFAVASRLPTAKGAGLDLRLIASTIHAEAHAADAFILGASGPSTNQTRVALHAYPEAFDGLVDIALREPWWTTGGYRDVMAVPTASELQALPRVWTALRPDDPAITALFAAGFRARTVTNVSGVPVMEWVPAADSGP